MLFIVEIVTVMLPLVAGSMSGPFLLRAEKLSLDSCVVSTASFVAQYCRVAYNQITTIQYTRVLSSGRQIQKLSRNQREIHRRIFCQFFPFGQQLLTQLIGVCT